MNEKTQLKEFVETELTNEWWKDGHEKYTSWGEKLLDKGFSLDDVKKMFVDLYGAVQEQYE